MRTDGRIIEWMYNEVKTEETVSDITNTVYKDHYIEQEDKKLRLDEGILSILSNKYAVIKIKDEEFLVYRDFEKSCLYIDPTSSIFDDRYPKYEGISNITLRELTEFVAYPNYRIFVRYYDYEESVLCIQKAESNIKPQNLTEWEMDYLSERLIKHIFQSQKLQSELYDGFDLEIESRCRQVRENLELQLEQFETKLIGVVRIMLEKEHEVKKQE